MSRPDAEPDDARLDAPAFHRNAAPILAVLEPRLAGRAGHALEIASGSGQHAVALAQALPDLVWWPSDASARCVASIEARRAEAQLSALRPARLLDVCAARWPLGSGADHPPAALAAVVCINMVHIAPWQAAVCLLQLAADALAPDGILYLYGPYRRGGRHTAPSNEAFDRSLRAQDARFGVRDLEAVAALAAERGLALAETLEMPANNLSLIFRRSS